MPFPTPRPPPTENVAGETAKTSEDRQVDPNLFLTMLYVSVVPFPCGRKKATERRPTIPHSS